MRYPAGWWRDALPSGNGTVGACVYGNIGEETVLLNHEAIWRPSRTQDLPDVSDRLPVVRELIRQGRDAEADQVYGEAFKKHGYDPSLGMYQPAFDMKLQMHTDAAFKDYRRVLDMETGEVAVRWMDGDVLRERLLFVSRADDVVVWRIGASQPGQVAGKLTLAKHDLIDAVRWWHREEFDPEIVCATKADGDMLTFSGSRSDGSNFGGVARVIVSGGTLATADDTVEISGADEALILLKLYANEPADGALQRLATELRGLQPDYDGLLAANAEVHGELFRRMTLELDDSDRDRSNEELLLQAYSGEMPTVMVEKMWAYGRYLLISSSRSGGLPANLQGIWNGDYEPPWWCFFMLNENTNMNYWQALGGNIAETLLPLFEHFEGLMDDFRVNARNLYGCRGIYVPAPTTPESGLLKVLAPHIASWTGGAGWLGQIFYDYWCYTGDEIFLRERALPYMREVALFYEDFLTEDNEGFLEFRPSHSPENRPVRQGSSGSWDDGAFCAVNATMDVAICRELLTNLLDGARLAGVYEDQTPTWEAMLGKLRPYQINEDGAIKEWMHPDYNDRYHHRHLSHLYPVHPGIEARRAGNTELIEAFRIALEKRLTLGIKDLAGWSLTHMANACARLQDGDKALECLEILSRSCLGQNLFTYHNDYRQMGVTFNQVWGRSRPFQIDSNMGWSAAVQEMLLFGGPETIELLPALPTKWRSGRVTGMVCRGGVEVAMEWDMDEGRVEATLKARNNACVNIKVPGTIEAVDGPSDQWKDDCITDISLPAGMPVTLCISISPSPT